MDEINNDDEYVVLLHGIGRTKQVMDKMSRFLEVKGYGIYNDDYQSNHHPIEVLVDQIAERIAQNCPEPNRKIHFVAHSMGAIITRLLIAKYRPQNLGRVVMLGPPNQGSHLIDFMKRFKFFNRLYGPAAKQLSKEGTLLQGLPPPDYEVGIIAGDRSIDLIFSWFILSGKNDGKVTVKETNLEGMKDHLVVHVAHPFIPNNKIVQEQTAYFLACGRFLKKV